jgi:hypothetical protein
MIRAMNGRNHRVRLGAILAFAFTASAILPLSSASGRAILEPASASSTQTQFGAPDNARNQSGLSIGYTSLVTDFDSYLASNPLHNSQDQANRWTSTSLPASIDFDLGGTFTIDRIAFWNQGTGIGSTRAFTLLGADNPQFNNAITLGNFNPVAVGDVTMVAAQVFDFAATSAHYVRFTATQSNGFDGATVGEVAFDLPVPEPAACSLLILSAGAGLLARRGRRA